ncbi:glycoside hydrolase family 16 [Pseudopedobacter saltans DSM 12145]|uniref:Glycoside hydrolase family 16 n=1 Tax=Pseudopedobacter saltans (strain ATCC 51119 / DSM 12145 / JCM 21818 / CCUG 39354 / LMG 10337 / NBRC 100064 / NCIMB 13643) TaxID=762903 RepID=F0S659_PSESL|nr:family 16 glycosylhydrolase [Pseudopedobacter saltans]ADY53173.1 glycoside hydrolase family 16 [Pseudopedobacter saltans DSM 12145]
MLTNYKSQTVMYLSSLLVLLSCGKKPSDALVEPDKKPNQKLTKATTKAVSNLLWADEFDGTSLDTSKWIYETGNGCPSLCGWGNNEKQYYTTATENVKVTNGKLNLTVKYKPNYQGSGSSFTSGKISTATKFSWLYGRFEARIKVPEGLGMWPAFWMLPKDKAYGGWPTSGEIDIMEYRGDIQNKIGGTLHYGNGWPNNQNDGTSYYLPTGNFSDQFHVFSVEWEPGIIRFYVDDVLFKTETKTPNSLSPASNNEVKWPWDKDFYILLNFAVGGWYTGNPTTADIINGDTNYTRTMEVDYVRVYGIIPLNNTLQFMGSNGKYISAQNTSSMICNVSTPGNAEKFTIIDAGSGKVALKYNGKYVSSENGTGAMTCTRSTIGNWEKFDYIVNNDGTISLKGNNGKYVSTDGGTNPMICNRTNIGNWEKFKIDN